MAICPDPSCYPADTWCYRPALLTLALPTCPALTQCATPASCLTPCDPLTPNVTHLLALLPTCWRCYPPGCDTCWYCVPASNRLCCSVPCGQCVWGLYHTRSIRGYATGKYDWRSNGHKWRVRLGEGRSFQLRQLITCMTDSQLDTAGYLESFYRDRRDWKVALLNSLCPCVWRPLAETNLAIDCCTGNVWSPGDRPPPSPARTCTTR